jgi:hypothetical protein
MKRTEYDEIVRYFDCSVRQPLEVIKRLFDKEQYEGAGIACNMLDTQTFVNELRNLVDEETSEPASIEAEYEDCEDQEDQVVETETPDAVS